MKLLDLETRFRIKLLRCRNKGSSTTGLTVSAWFRELAFKCRTQQFLEGVFLNLSPLLLSLLEMSVVRNNYATRQALGPALAIYAEHFQGLPA